MCRTSTEIRKSDFTCIALDEYIKFRKKQVNGDKESLAYFDVLRAEADIENRITTVQNREDMLQRFTGVSKQIKNVSTKVGQCKIDIDGVGQKLDDHIKEVESNPTLIAMAKEKPGKVLLNLTWIVMVYFIVFQMISYLVGFDNLLLGLINTIPGIDF